MKKIKHYLLSLLMVSGVTGGSLMFAAPIASAACQGTDCITTGVDAVNGNNQSTNLTAFVKNIINILLFVVGAVSVVMIIIGGLRYATSAGDQSNVKAAKDTILYSVVGLVIAFLAFAIVNFVIDSL